MAKKKSSYRYRDSKTGRFASKASWQRSRREGRRRYKREKVVRERPTGKRQRPPISLPPTAPVRYEWVVAFTYDRTGKSFDVIVVATNENEAYAVSRQFLARDEKGQRILTPSGRLKRGWNGVPVRGRETLEEVGSAEYREDSEDE